jgi:exodeoxyribonuclease V beta subunit
MLACGLEAAITASLGPTVGELRLSDLGRSERLDELRFELPLGGGDEPSDDVLTADLAELFAKHVRPGQPLASYGHALANPKIIATLRGYLTGSLDLVFRSVVAGGNPRFFVADYKTNWLGRPGQSLTAWDYRPAALEAEMCRAHYPLQALFYLVALHRYLRWRQPGYDPGTHLGGALYLFVRGMAVPAAIPPGSTAHGVFAWVPPPRLVSEASDLLAGRGRRDRHNR